MALVFLSPEEEQKKNQLVSQLGQLKIVEEKIVEELRKIIYKLEKK